MNASGPVHPQSGEIIAALPLRHRGGLYVKWPLGWHVDELGAGVREHCYPILKRSASPRDVVVGLAVPGDDEGWYLGCLECEAEITEEDSGMCGVCRKGSRRNRPAARWATRESTQPQDATPWEES